MIAVASAAETHVDVVTAPNSRPVCVPNISRKHSGLNEGYVSHRQKRRHASQPLGSYRCLTVGQSEQALHHEKDFSGAF